MRFDDFLVAIRQIYVLWRGTAVRVTATTSSGTSTTAATSADDLSTLAAVAMPTALRTGTSVRLHAKVKVEERSPQLD